MTRLVWDNLEDRVYHTGLDRGVLYLQDGSGVPWNGLVSIVEHSDREMSPVYFDGMKVNNIVSSGDFSATLTAITYPEEFEQFEGFKSLKDGLYLGDQRFEIFNLSYRVKVGNAVSPDPIGYKIHILYNLNALPSDKTYQTLSDVSSLVNFEWEISACPEEIPLMTDEFLWFRPTAHIVIDSLKMDPVLFESIEEMLYGSEFTQANLPSMVDLLTTISEFFRIQIIDNGNGTWTAISRGDDITFINPELDEFQISDVAGRYLDSDTYQISNTNFD